MFHFAQIALWAFLVVLVAAVNAAPRYRLGDDGEEGNKEMQCNSIEFQHI
jgi:hypothetical protein